MGYFILTSHYHLRATMKLLYITLLTSLPVLCGNGYVTCEYLYIWKITSRGKKKLVRPFKLVLFVQYGC